MFDAWWIRGFRLFFAALTLVATASTSIAVAQTPEPSTGTDLTAWAVSDQQGIAVNGEPVSISPDGNWLAGPGENDDFCIWSLPDLEPSCDGEELRPQPESIAWAPDSSAVAFSQDAPRFLIDSDITVFDVESKQLDNLTDVPGEERRVPLGSSGDEVFVADIMPVWTADSSTILFIRSEFGAGLGNTVIMSLDVTSGEVSNYFLVAPTIWFSVYTPMFIEPDGSLLISVGNPDPDNQQNGIWRIAPGGSRIDRVFDPETQAWRAGVTISDVATDGSYALLLSMTALSFSDPAESPYALLDLATGELTGIFEVDSAMPWQSIFGYPHFAGDGTGLIYATRDDPAIYVGADDPLEIGRLPEDLEMTTGTSWSDSGKLLIPGGDGTALVVTLEMTGDEPAPCSCTPPPIG
jgi:hypothetical protein